MLRPDLENQVLVLSRPCLLSDGSCLAFGSSSDRVLLLRLCGAVAWFWCLLCYVFCMHMRHSDAIGCLVHPMRAWDQVVSLFLRSGLDLARMAISSMLLRF